MIYSAFSYPLCFYYQSFPDSSFFKMLYRTSLLFETLSKAKRSNLTKISSELTNTEVDEIPKQVRGCWKMLNMRKKAWLVWDKEWTDWSPRQCLVAQLKKVSKLAFPVQGLHCLEELGLQVSAGTALPTAATLCPDVTVAAKLQLCLQLLLTSPMYLAVAENSRGTTAFCKHPFKHLFV